MQLPLPFRMSSLSCMRAKIQSSSCYNDSPKTNFPLTQQAQVCGILLPEPHKIVKTLQHYMLLLFIFPCVLIKALQNTDSLEARELE